MEQADRDRNEDTLARLRALVERLLPADLDRSLGEGWTVQAALLHLAFWDRYATRCLEQFARNGFAPLVIDSETVDAAINSAALPEWVAAPPSHALAAVIAAVTEANRVAAACPEDLIATLEAAGEAWFRRFRHREEHLEQIARVLP